MKRLLICGCSQNGFSTDMIRKITNDTTIEYISTIVSYEYEKNLFERESIAILRDDCIVGKYKDYYKKFNLVEEELDGELLTALRPSLFDLLMIFRRHEDKRAYRLSPRLDDHYALLMKQLLFWHTYLVEGKIELVIFSEVPHEGYDNVIYTLCKLLGIQMLICANYYAARTNEYLLLSDFNDMADMLASKYAQNKTRYKKKEEEKRELKPETIELIRGFQKKSHFKAEIVRKKSFGSQIGYLNAFDFWQDYYRKNVERYKNNHGIHSITPINRMGLYVQTVRMLPEIIRGYSFTLKKWHESQLFIKQYEEIAELPVDGEKYIYFALHKEPEMAVNPMGGVFFDQFLAIKLLSQAVPQGWKVYVKIHPIQLHFMMNIDSFQSLKEISNIRIISERVEQTSLISNAQAVSSLTGDVIIEAMFGRIPSLVFGHGYRCVCPTAYRVSTIEDIKQALSVISEKKVSCTDDDIELYFKTIDEYIYIGYEGIMEEIIRRIKAEAI